MTKKDYELIASSLNKVVTMAHKYKMNPQLVEAIAMQLTLDLANANPRFDRDKFLKASGVKPNDTV